MQSSTMPFLTALSDKESARVMDKQFQDVAKHGKDFVVDGDAESSAESLTSPDDTRVATTDLKSVQDNTTTTGMDADGTDVNDDPSSRPPSPPDSGVVTPQKRAELCPKRLRPLIPALNYGTVDYRSIYRSSFPQDRNIDFMKTLHIKHVLTLVDTAPSAGYLKWTSEHNVTRTSISILPNKDGKVRTTLDSMCEALLFILDSSHHPLYIHCNQGRHRTGCVVACLRRIQRWPLEEILEEYRAYASPKAREADVQLIKSFQPHYVFDYAKEKGYFGDGPVDFPTAATATAEKNCSGPGRLKRFDSTITNIDMLAEALAAGAMDGSPSMSEDALKSSSVSTVSSIVSDGPLEMRMFSTPLPCSTKDSSTECIGLGVKQNGNDHSFFTPLHENPAAATTTGGCDETSYPGSGSTTMDVNVVELDEGLMSP